MLGGSFKLIRILGIDIRVHPSWLVVFALVTWSLAAGYFPVAVPDLSPERAWLLGAVASLLFFGSVLAHELSHSLVARSRGLGVHSITLFIFGGVSSLTSEAQSPGTEFIVSVVGPVTSLLIAAASLLIASQLSDGTGLNAVFAYLGIVNVLVGVFNLIPGFPLDGGRVLRSVVWRITGNLRQATRVAALIGQLVAYLLMFWGLLQIFTGHVFDGLWSVAIGWFLQSAASSSVEQQSIDSVLSGTRVRDVFRHDIVAVRPNESIESVVAHVMIPLNLESVVVADDRVIGMATAKEMARVPVERRAATPVAAVTTPAQRFGIARPNDTLRDAVGVLRNGNLELVPVVEQGRLVGLLSRDDVMRAIELRGQLGRAA